LAQLYSQQRLNLEQEKIMQAHQVMSKNERRTTATCLTGAKVTIKKRIDELTQKIMAPTEIRSAVKELSMADP